jgi:uncharacterized protein involved in exopolysaccharide biosynthesis
MTAGVIVRIDSKDFGIIDDVLKRLQTFLPNNKHVTIRQRGQYEVVVESEKLDETDVDIALQRYQNYSPHIFRYKLIQVDVEKMELWEKEVRETYEGRIQDLEDKQWQSEEVWKEERRNYKQKIGELGAALRAQYKDFKKRRKDSQGGILDTQGDYDKCMILADKRIECLQGQVNDLERQLDEFKERDNTIAKLQRQLEESEIPIISYVYGCWKNFLRQQP